MVNDGRAAIVNSRLDDSFFDMFIKELDQVCLENPSSSGSISTNVGKKNKRD